MSKREDEDEPSPEEWIRKKSGDPPVEAEQSLRGFIARLRMMFGRRDDT